MDGLQIQLLGPLRVSRGASLIDLGSKKQRALFALLVAAGGEAVSIDRIIMSLWGPDAPPERRDSVYVYVSRLRRALGHSDESPVLLRRSEGYSLVLDDSATDTAAFENLIEEARSLLSHDPAAASLAAGEAIAMWGGRPFDEFGLDDFLVAEAARLEELYLSAVELRLEADLKWRPNEELIPELEGLAIEHPTRTRLVASLMLALYRSGRQADALQAYRRTAELLAESGLVPPSDLSDLEKAILLEDPALLPFDITGSYPSPLIDLVGREQETAEVIEALGESRVVTIWGPGGVGKTGLALEVARQRSLIDEPVVFVDLVPAGAGPSVASLIAAAFKVRPGGSDPLAAVLDRIGSRRVLMLLDNCEHVASDAARAAAEMLRLASGLRVLATSRVILGVPGERSIPLGPLETDPGGSAEVLLLARVRDLGIGHDDELTPAEQTEIVERTAGIPLAIELAAAQLRTWPAGSLIDALRHSIDALAMKSRAGPDHQQDFRSNIAWSEQLLTAEGVSLLRRLAVFQPSATDEAILEVTDLDGSGEATVRAAISEMVAASLLQRIAAPVPRFRMLEPVRDFARSRLAEPRELAELLDRHAKYFLKKFREEALDMHLGSDPSLLPRLSHDDANLRAAIRRTIDKGDDLAVAQAAAAAAIPMWRSVANLGEVLELVVELLPPDGSATRERADLLFRSIAPIRLVMGRDEAARRLEELEAMAAAIGTPEVEAWALMRRADLRPSDESDEQVIALYEHSAALFEEVGSSDVVYPLHNLSWIATWSGVESAAPERLMAVARERGWLAAEADALRVLAARSLLAGNLDNAERLARRSVTLFRQLGDRTRAAQLLVTLAICALLRGDTASAQQRIEPAAAAVGQIGSHIDVALTALIGAEVDLRFGQVQSAVQRLEVAANPGVWDGFPEVVSLLVGAIARSACGVLPLRAGLLFGAFERLSDPSSEMRGTPPPMTRTRTMEAQVVLGVDSDATARALAALRTRLGEQELARLMEEGSELSAEDAREESIRVLSSLAERTVESVA